jgi:hypothetical protein
MMKRFLNKLRRFEVLEITDSSYKYKLNDSITPDENELFIGKISEENKGLFVYKTKVAKYIEAEDNWVEEALPEPQIFSVSYDDFSYDFLDKENKSLNDAYNALLNDINVFNAIPDIPDETNGGDE